MFELIAMATLLLWIVGILSARTFGGFLHLFLAVAILAMVVPMMRAGRK